MDKRSSPVDEIKVTHKPITVAGRKLTVWKKTFEMQLRRFTLIEQAEQSLNGNGIPQEGEGIEATIRRGFSRVTYPSLAACTTGKVFTEAECFQIENDDLEAWLEAARELNPDWFPAVTTETDDSEEKKELPG
jgi:hypothetical protein